MEFKTIVALILVVIVAVTLLFLLNSPAKSGAKGSTISTTTTAALNANTSSVTTTIGVVQWYAINVDYIYSGPQSINGVNCSYVTQTTIDNSQNMILNGTDQFNLKYVMMSDSECAMTVNYVKAVTPGFSVLSEEPTLPITLAVNSQEQVQVNMMAPNTSYYGPLTIDIGYS